MIKWFKYTDKCFRPQQGLTIMNYLAECKSKSKAIEEKFPSPTGVNYYELKH